VLVLQHQEVLEKLSRSPDGRVNIWLSLEVTLLIKALKFGEALTSHVDGNPELSLFLGKCRDLTGAILRDKEKVQA